MNDIELLELAAKAACIELVWNDRSEPGYFSDWKGYSNWNPWNPLTDDGDALRLAVRLEIPIFPYGGETSTGTVGVVAKNWGSKEANTRRAIVRAAAQIQMDKETK